MQALYRESTHSRSMKSDSFEVPTTPRPCTPDELMHLQSLSTITHLVEALEAWPGPQPLMLRSNRCGSGPVYDTPDDRRLGLLAAGDLNPAKARVLLLLALIAGLDHKDLEALL